MVEWIEDQERRKQITDRILNELPDWFGIPDSIREYVEGCADKPYWAWMEGTEPVGFFALKENSPYTAEVYVCGIRNEYQGRGIGKMLFQALFGYAKEHGYQFLQVKTVREGCYESYDRTNQFYRKMGFREFECFPELWDVHNPCQIYVMAIT